MSLDPRLISAFDRAYGLGFSVRVDEADVPFTVLDLGLLSLRSGRLVACDPLADLTDQPLAAELPVGRFAVRLAVIESPEWGDRTVFARLVLSDRPVVRWEMAPLAGEDASNLEEGEVTGYGVDAGTGCFVDAETARALLADEDGHQVIIDAWIPEKREGVIYPYGDGDIAVFHSGFGDGFYGTYLGYDADAALAAVVTDFAVIDWTTQP